MQLTQVVVGNEHELRYNSQETHKPMNGYGWVSPLTAPPSFFPTPRACHGTSNGGVGAVRIVDPKDLVMGLDEEEQLQDLEGILSSGPPMIQSMPQGWSRLQPWHLKILKQVYKQYNHTWWDNYMPRSHEDFTKQKWTIPSGATNIQAEKNMR